MADKFEILNKRLKDVKEKFEALNKSGIDEEILIVYLQVKTHLSKKNVKLLLKSQEDFYDKLVSNEMIKQL